MKSKEEIEKLMKNEGIEINKEDIEEGVSNILAGMKEKKAVKETMSAAEIELFFAELNKEYLKGMDLLKNTQYNESQKIFTNCLTIFEKCRLSQSQKIIPEREFQNRFAGIQVQLAECYKGLQNYTKIIESCSECIRSQADDPNTFTQAYYLRAVAYEKENNFLRAKEDLSNLLNLIPKHEPALSLLKRINENIDQIKLKHEEDTYQSILKNLDDIKKAGNECYKSKNYLKANQHFTEGIDLFMKTCDIQFLARDKLLILCQLYTNRSISNHMLDRHFDVIDDATFVLNKIDPQNAKAFYRRGHALSQMGDWENALSDLEKALGLDPNNANVKEELNIAMGKVIERKKLKENIEEEKEVDHFPKEEKTKQKIQEISEESAPPKIKPKKKPEKEKKISEEQIKNAISKAENELGNSLFSKPKTSYGFENIWRSYKNDYKMLYKFLKVCYLTYLFRKMLNPIYCLHFLKKLRYLQRFLKG